MQSTQPKISVLMSVYNGERYLNDSIDSILAQTFRDFEFVIIDDASTDQTTQILRQYAQQDSRIRLIRNHENVGLTRSLNKGLQNVRGIYVARQDADDISLPDRFEKQIRYFEQHPEVILLGTWAKVIDEHGKVVGQLASPTDDCEITWRLTFSNAFVHTSVMMNAEKMRSNGIQYDASFVTSQDYDLWQRLSRLAPVANLPEFLVVWRRHGVNITASKEEQQKKNCLAVSLREQERLLGGESDAEVAQRISQSRGSRVNLNTLEGHRELRYLLNLVNAFGHGNPRFDRSQLKKISNRIIRESFITVRLVTLPIWFCRRESAQMAVQHPILFVCHCTDRIRRYITQNHQQKVIT